MKSLFVGVIVAFRNISFAYEFGILYNRVTLSDLNSHGCSKCYSNPYSESTTTQNVGLCAGPILFVGAKGNNTSTFLLGAYGLSSEIQNLTEMNKPHVSYGVKWYKTPGYSFGFLDPRGQLNQRTADVGEDYSDSRLSWHLDLNVGGYRAGSYMYLNSAETFSKNIYNCPASVNMPSLNPTLFPSKAPNPASICLPTLSPSTPKPTFKRLSSVPTWRPTLRPTPRPTSKPTPRPTLPQILMRTSQPTSQPTSEPTLGLTVRPSSKGNL